MPSMTGKGGGNAAAAWALLAGTLSSWIGGGVGGAAGRTGWLELHPINPSKVTHVAMNG